MSKDILTNYLENLFNYEERDVEKYINVSCGIIVKEIDEIKHVLLIQRAKNDFFPGQYELPRGKCDKTPNEKLIHCLKREVKEEVGLDVIPLRVIDKFSYIADEGKRKSTQYNFLCKMKNENQEVKLSHEHDDYMWIKSLGEVELLVLPELKKSISRALNFKESLVNYNDTDQNDQDIEE